MGRLKAIYRGEDSGSTLVLASEQAEFDAADVCVPEVDKAELEQIAGLALSETPVEEPADLPQAPVEAA